MAPLRQQATNTDRELLLSCAGASSRQPSGQFFMTVQCVPAPLASIDIATPPIIRQVCVLEVDFSQTIA
jgi:hypothetical protein